MNLRNRIAKAIQYHRAVRELSALDNRQLADLGITRYDIQDVARGQTR